MIVLQAGMLEGRLWLWGETPQEEAPAKSKTRSSQTKPQPKRLPYDAGAADLACALMESLPNVNISAAECETRFVWLPTVGTQPIASSPLIALPPDRLATAVPSPWEITALPLTAEQATALLCACVGRETLASGVIVGKSLAYWTLALRFAGTLVARQQFLPGITVQDKAFFAVWEPVYLGADTERRNRLAQAMPAVCRALARDAAAPPDTPALSLLTEFCGLICDALVRTTPVPAEGWEARGLAAPPARRPTSKTPTFDSLHAQWLYALRAPTGRMEGDAGELRAFAAQVREWRRPLTVSAAAPFRFCFRLEEPDEEADGENARWFVRYLLQDLQDPSLLIPADKAWAAKGRTAALLQRENFQPREFLLMALGSAAQIYSRIEESLKAAAPDGFVCDTPAAYTFLTETAWQLEQAGFGVLLPAWWTRKGTKQRLTARAAIKSPKMQNNAGLSLETLVNFDWQVALGDQMLTRQELEALARQKSALVKVRGQWVELNPDEILAALDFWKRKGEGQTSVRDVVRMALGAAQMPGGVGAEDVAASGWVADLLAQLQGHAALEEIALPSAFQGELRPYQRRGCSWLHFLQRWGLGACLADDMGLGKTPQTLAFLRQHWEQADKRPTLIICPTSVVGNWQKEAARFTPDLPVMVHHGLGRIRGESFAEEAGRHALVLSSYALLHRDFDLLKAVSWAAIILDEAQNIKNPETKQAKAARALQADCRIALTGTPVENHVGDLWSLMEFLNPGFLGNQAEFRRRFFVPIQAGHDPEAADRLKKLSGPFILRRLKTDKSIIADLPEKNEMKVFCTLTREQASLYQAVVKEAEEALDEAEGIQRKGVVLATLSKLKQICNHPAQFLGDNSALPGRSGKLARLTEMLEEALEIGDKALIFSQFAEMGELLRRHLQATFGQEVLFLHGGVSKPKRDQMVERFQAKEGGPRLFILSLKAGGTGLNLTAANHVFHFDRWWNPAVENQATDRAFRIGQTKNVQVHKFLCAGTMEEKIDEMIESKQQVAAHVVGTGEDWLTELSTTELKALFALRREALAE